MKYKGRLFTLYNKSEYCDKHKLSWHNPRVCHNVGC